MEFIKPRSAKNALLDADGKPIFDENSWKHLGTLKKNLGSYRALTCPTLGNKPVPNKLTDKHDVSYWLLTDKKLNLHNAKKTAATIILVCPHHQDAYGAAFADGHCEIMKCPVRFNDSRIRTTLSSCQPFHDATDRIGPPEPKAAMACKSSGTQSPKLPATR